MAASNFYFSENGKNYDATFLIDADGEILGCQKMVHEDMTYLFFLAIDSESRSHGYGGRAIETLKRLVSR